MNIYAETDKPQNFFKLAFGCILFLTIFIAVSISYIGYFAFGSEMKSVIIYNLPYYDTLSTLVRVCFVITICGSFVLLSQPVFHVIEASYFYQTGSWGYKEQNTALYDADINASEKSESHVGRLSGIKDFGSSIVESWSFQRWVKHVAVRVTIVIIVFLIAAVVPNINILLTFTGACIGTMCNVWVPVLFYNRAYNTSYKNRSLESPLKPLLHQSEDAKISDNRAVIKYMSWFVFVLGTLSGMIGVYYVAIRLQTAKEDSV